MKRVELKIYYLENNAAKVRCSVNKWTFLDAMMGEQYISFSITSEKPIEWAIGDYCVFRGETYTLNYIPSVTQKAKTGVLQDSYTYENIKFESFQEELTRCIMLDITPTTGDYKAALGTNYTGSSVFQLFCGETSTIIGNKVVVLTAVCALAAKMQANLDRLFPDKGWHIYVDTDTTYKDIAGKEIPITHTDDKVLSFNNTTVAQALSEVHNTFDLSYCVKGREIRIGYNLKNLTGDNEEETFAFGYGKGFPTHDDQNKGLFQLKRIANSQQKIVTRLRALGSTKNLPYRYYNKRYAEHSIDLSQTLFPTNLQLPDTFIPEGDISDDKGKNTKWGHNKQRDPFLRAVRGDTNDAYIDKNDNAESCVEGIREDCARFDGSNGDLPEIYPTIEGATYSELRNALIEDQDGKTGPTAFNKYENTERIDSLLSVGYYSDGKIIDDANKGNGILPENGELNVGIVKKINIEQKLLKYATDLSGDFIKKNGYFEGPTQELFKISNVNAGKYVMVPSGPSMSSVVFNIKLDSKTYASAQVGYIITIIQKNKSDDARKEIASYPSDYTFVTLRDEEIEIVLPEIPDVAKSENAKVTEIVVDKYSDIEVNFTPTIKSPFLDTGGKDFTFVYSVGEPHRTEKTHEPEYIWRSLDDNSSVEDIFHVFIKDMGFDISACWSDDTPIMHMKSGRCVGREFEIKENIQKVTYEGKKCYMLTLGRATDSSLNTYYPSATDPIAAGDYFVFLGINMPDAYVDMAEIRLLRAATDYLADNCETVFTYQPSIDDIYLQRNLDLMEKQGTPEKSVFWRLYAGLKFTFRGIPISSNEDDPLPLADITIERVKIEMGDGLTPKVELTLNDDVQQSTLQKLTTSVDRIYNGSLFSNGGATSSNATALYSLIQTEGGKLFISKKKDDAASGHITFKSGLTSEEDVSVDKNIYVEENVDTSGLNVRGTSRHGDISYFDRLAEFNLGWLLPHERRAWVKGVLSLLSLDAETEEGKGGVNGFISGNGTAELRGLTVKPMPETSARAVDGVADLQGKTYIAEAVSKAAPEETADFVDGFDGHGFRLWKEGSEWKLTLDELTVRQTMRVYELLINKVRSIGGSFVISAANGKIKSVSETSAYYIIELESGGDFVVGDYLRCQSWKNAATTPIKGYITRITGIQSAGESAYHYVLKSDFAAGVMPEEGDEVVQWGNDGTDTDRQNLIYITSTDGGGARVDLLTGVAGNDNGEVRVRLGDLSGVVADGATWHGLTPQGWGLLADNVYLRGDLVIAGQNDTVGHLFAVTKERFESTYSELKALTNGESVVRNHDFTDGTSYWQPTRGSLLSDGTQLLAVKGDVQKLLSAWTDDDGFAALMESGAVKFMRIQGIETAHGIRQNVGDMNSMTLDKDDDGRDLPCMAELSFRYRVVNLDGVQADSVVPSVSVTSTNYGVTYTLSEEKKEGKDLYGLQGSLLSDGEWHTARIYGDYIGHSGTMVLNFTTGAHLAVDVTDVCLVRATGVEKLSTSIDQTARAISLLSNSITFDKDGNITNFDTSGLVTQAGFTATFSSNYPGLYKDGELNVATITALNKAFDDLERMIPDLSDYATLNQVTNALSGFYTKKDMATMFAGYFDEDGNFTIAAQISALVTRDEVGDIVGELYISADKITNLAGKIENIVKEYKITADNIDLNGLTIDADSNVTVDGVTNNNLMRIGFQAAEGVRPITKCFYCTPNGNDFTNIWFDPSRVGRMVMLSKDFNSHTINLPYANSNVGMQAFFIDGEHDPENHIPTYDQLRKCVGKVFTFYTEDGVGNTYVQFQAGELDSAGFIVTEEELYGGQTDDFNNIPDNASVTVTRHISKTNLKILRVGHWLELEFCLGVQGGCECFYWKARHSGSKLTEY